MSRSPKHERAHKRISRVRRVHDYFFPHERNAYRPHFFSGWSLAVIAIGLVALNLAYLVETRIVFKETDFLAAVLPGVLTDLTNEDRVAHSLPEVIHDPALARAAQLAVNDMAEKGYFAHNSPEGKTPWHWLREAGYAYTYAGQNLAVNFNDSKEVEDGWMNSPTHRANIMKREYTRVGIAVANGTYKGKEATFVVQYFATPPGSSAAPVASIPTTPAPAAEATPTPSVAVLSTEELPAEEAPAAEEVAREDVGTTTEVLGAQDPPVPVLTIAAASEPVGFLAQVVTSPKSTMIIILTFLTAAVIVLLGIAIGTHLRRQYVEVIGGGLILILIMLGLLLFQVRGESDVVIPEGDGSSVEI